LTFENQPPPEHAQRVEQHHENVAKSDRRKQLTKESEAGKRFRRGGRGRRRRVRRKDWTDDAYRTEDELDHNPLERVMSLDEHDRRREVEKAVLQTTTHSREQAASVTTTTTGQQALVVAAGGLQARVLMDGVELKCTIRGILTEIETGFINPVAVGDQVLVSEDGANGWVIQEVLPRKTILARPDSFLAPKQQVIAANVDLLLIVSAWWDPTIWLELIDRYLVVAQRTGIEPIICINKVDLMDDEDDYEDEDDEDMDDEDEDEDEDEEDLGVEEVDMDSDDPLVDDDSDDEDDPDLEALKEIDGDLDEDLDDEESEVDLEGLDGDLDLDDELEDEESEDEDEEDK